MRLPRCRFFSGPFWKDSSELLHEKDCVGVFFESIRREDEILSTEAVEAVDSEAS